MEHRFRRGGEGPAGARAHGKGQARRRGRTACVGPDATIGEDEGSRVESRGRGSDWRAALLSLVCVDVLVVEEDRRVATAVPLRAPIVVRPAANGDRFATGRASGALVQQTEICAVHTRVKLIRLAVGAIEFFKVVAM